MDHVSILWECRSFMYDMKKLVTFEYVFIYSMSIYGSGAISGREIRYAR